MMRGVYSSAVRAGNNCDKKDVELAGKIFFFPSSGETHLTVGLFPDAIIR